MTQKISIQDESGDKNFFTIVPNFIINHSTAIDRALYLEMKRFAGENGKCFATEKTMMKRLGIGKKSFDKSLEYLLKRGWVSYVGLKEGKTRPIKTYKINDIWQENSDNYKKISSESNRDKFQKQHKISSESNVEEETYKEEKKEDIYIQQSGDCELNKQIAEIFNTFKTINPFINFGHKTQRQACAEMLKKLGYEQLLEIAKLAVNIQGQPYAPTITNPYQLKIKFGELASFIKKENNSLYADQELSLREIINKTLQ